MYVARYSQRIPTSNHEPALRARPIEASADHDADVASTSVEDASKRAAMTGRDSSKEASCGVEERSEHVPTPSALPKRFVRAALLLLLLEQPAHGYELLVRLRPFGFQRADTGGIYRNLRALEDAGLVHSDWRQSAAGPHRHVYQITRAGRDELHSHAKALAATLQLFLSRYLEFVDLTDLAGTRRTAGKPAARRPRKSGRASRNASDA